jgi:putative SOS response-associated peptidase YedK
MCGRFSLTCSPEDLKAFSGLVKVPDFDRRYNIAPSQAAPAIRLEAGERRLVFLHWGLIPFWAGDPKIGYRTINARAETVHKSPGILGTVYISFNLSFAVNNSICRPMNSAMVL